MSWMCTGCSEKHLDGVGAMGFGLCKTCSEKMRAKSAKERADMIAAKKKKKSKRK